MQPKIKKTRLFLPALILIFSLALTVFAWKETKGFIEYQTHERFNSATREIVIRTEDKLNEYIDILYAARALFAASENVERDEWRVFINTQNFSERLPGIQALEFVNRVGLEEKDDFIVNVKSNISIKPSGYPSFSIYPEGEREEYFVVNYIEPIEGNEKAFGFDLASNPDRREALEKARDTGLPIATAPITLVQETGEQAGFLIFLAVYKKDMPVDTLEERRIGLNGFVLAVFRADDLFSALLDNIGEVEGINIEIFDYTDSLSEKSKLFSHEHGDSLYQPMFFEDSNLDIASRKWVLHFENSSEFFISSVEKILPLIVLGVGLIFSILVFLVLYSLFRTKDKAIELAKKITIDLATSKKEADKARKLAEDKAVEVEKANTLMMGRESRILELKEENQRLRKGQDEKKKPRNHESGFYDSNI